MIEAIIRGEQDPERLADLSQGRLKGLPPRRRRAATRRVTAHHRFLLRLHLMQIGALKVAVRDVEARLGGPKKAIVAVAASMLTAAYFILTNRTVHAEPGADYFDRRSKAQLTRRLIKRLEGLGVTMGVRPAA